MTVEERVVEFVNEKKKLPYLVKLESRFDEDLGISSTYLLSLTPIIVKQFKIPVLGEEDVEKIKTVQDLVNYVKSLNQIVASTNGQTMIFFALCSLPVSLIFVLFSCGEKGDDDNIKPTNGDTDPDPNNPKINETSKNNKKK